MIPVQRVASPEYSYDEYVLALSMVETVSRDTGACLAFSLDWLTKSLAGLAQDISTRFKVKLGDVVDAFKSKSIFNLLRSFGYSLSNLTQALTKGYRVLKAGASEAFEKLASSTLVQDLRKGVVKIDAVLSKYPVLKKLSGLALAGVLLYIWLSMSFVGNLDFDMDLSHVVEAAKGNFTLNDVFLSANGLKMLSLFALGTVTGLSFPWLMHSSANLILAAFYTVFKNTGKPAFAGKLKTEFKLGRFGK